MNLLRDVRITRVANAAIAATTPIDSAVLDMQGWDGVLFIALLGDVTATCALRLTARGNTASSTSSPTPVAQVATSQFVAGSADADNRVIAVDLFDPAMRFAFCTLERGVANAVVDGILAIQYMGDQRPTAQDVSVLLSAIGPGTTG